MSIKLKRGKNLELNTYFEMAVLRDVKIDKFMKLPFTSIYRLFFVFISVKQILKSDKENKIRLKLDKIKYNQVLPLSALTQSTLVIRRTNFDEIEMISSPSDRDPQVHLVLAEGLPLEQHCTKSL